MFEFHLNTLAQMHNFHTSVPEMKCRKMNRVEKLLQVSSFTWRSYEEKMKFIET
jgi:hypothetical protein